MIARKGPNTEPSLFDSPSPEPTTRPTRLGLTVIDYKQASSILTVPKGFMQGYDFTINPYSGCAFGCAYCYAAAFAPDETLSKDWGTWVRVKDNALDLLRRVKRDLRGKSIYISSVTDPYQPIERSLELTRSLLQELVHHQPRVIIQTRSPIVARDIDVLQQFEFAQVNMTVTTDDEDVRKAFEPGCPSNAQRLQAISEVQRAKVRACITMTPLLPVVNPETFADALLATGVTRFIVQPFHTKKGMFAAGTRDTATPLIDKYKWDGEGYAAARDVLRRKLNTKNTGLGEGKEGFAPV